MIKLHNSIRMYRAHVRMSQQELAKKVGVRRETISSLESGKYNPSLMLAMMISKALDVPIDTLFYIQEEKSK